MVLARSKKHKRYSDIFASSAGEKDNYGTMFESMLTSNTYKALSIGAKHFYTLCRVQAQSESGRRALYKLAEYEQRKQPYPQHFFVFPASHMRKYGVDDANGRKYMRELIACGFIVIKEDNSQRRIATIYAFSDLWKSIPA